MSFHTVRLKRLPHGAGLPLPDYQSVYASGVDLVAANHGAIVIPPGERRMIPTGFNIWIPDGFEGQVRPRSGLAAKHGISIVNAPGTIDADYRGEIIVIMINQGDREFTVNRGDRVAQLVIAPVTRAAFLEVVALDATERGEGGFGSTGVSLNP